MAYPGFPWSGSRAYGRNTQAANTVITQLVAPRTGLFTHLKRLWYNCSTTAHILTVMRPLNRTTASAAASAAQAVINFTADPGDYSTAQNGQTVRNADNAIAANDYVAYQVADGTWVLDTVASVATLAITMTTNVPTGGVLSGATIFWFGVVTDTNPNADAAAHPRYNLLANQVTYKDDPDCGFFGTVPGVLPNMTGKGEPLALVVDNVTVAGTLEEVVAGYSSKG